MLDHNELSRRAMRLAAKASIARAKVEHAAYRLRERISEHLSAPDDAVYFAEVLEPGVCGSARREEPHLRHTTDDTWEFALIVHLGASQSPPYIKVPFVFEGGRNDDGKVLLKSDFCGPAFIDSDADLAMLLASASQVLLDIVDETPRTGKRMIGFGLPPSDTAG